MVTLLPLMSIAQNVLYLLKGESTERYAEVIVLNGGRPGEGESDELDQAKPPLNPTGYSLSNYPNPFDKSTVIAVTLPENTTGELIITDVAGKQLQKITVTKTEQKIVIEASEWGQGLFFYSLYVDKKLIATKKMTQIH